MNACSAERSGIGGDTLRRRVQRRLGGNEGVRVDMHGDSAEALALYQAEDPGGRPAAAEG